MSALAYYLVAGSESSFPVDLGDVKEAFTRKIQSFFPANPVIWVSLKEVQEGLSQGVAKAKFLFPDALIVTLSSLYFPNADCEISANRVVDGTGTRLGLAHRPGAQSLSQQVFEVKHVAGGRPIVVVDDTLFHGETLELLEALGLRIDTAVEYFTGSEAYEKFCRKFSVISVLTLNSYKDVMPLHDFLPFLPLCGKVLGCVSEGSCAPAQTKDGYSISFPYLLPWITPVQLYDWASIPEENAVDFSVFALKQSIVVAQRLREYGYTTIGDAVRPCPPRRSIPWCDGQHMPDPHESVVDYLARSLHEISKLYQDEPG